MEDLSQQVLHLTRSDKIIIIMIMMLLRLHNFRRQR